ncbi:MAG: hypothetical protein WC139_10150 [Candidatus Kapaibacterium sp.]
MKKILVLITFILIWFSTEVNSQVTVAPVSIHMNDANKNGYLLIRNNSLTSTWEVNIEMKFGYPFSDSTGNINIYFPDTVTASDPSAIDWVNFFPRKFLLKPQEEQTVRVVAKPPKGLKEGEYWGRPIISSQVQSMEDTTNNSQIGVGLSVKFQTVIAFNYRKGKSSTSINLLSLDAVYEDSKIIVSADMKREGNSAYIGNLIAKVYDSRNDLISETEQEFAVYYTLLKKVTLDVPGIKKGNYTVEVELNTDRKEQSGTIIKGNTVNKKIQISVN